MHRLEVDIPASFDFASTVRRNIFGIGDVKVLGTVEVPVVVRAFWIADEPIGVRIYVDKQAEKLIVETEDAKATKHLLPLVRHWLDLDTDYEMAMSWLCQDPVLEPVVHALRGLYLQRDVDSFCCLVRMMIGQQVNVAFATTLTNRLIELVGRKVAIGCETLAVFPRAADVARLSVDTLRSLQFSERKAQYIVNLAKMVVDGQIDLRADKLDCLEDEELIAYLGQIRGVGRWSAQCCALFSLQRPDIFPAQDVGLLDAIGRLYGGVRPSIEQAADMAQAWSPYRSYAAHVLWCSRRRFETGMNPPQ
ncbi:DNA-3-methyladenine glycosylase family protein [Alicyclobacillus suci]|uniref:DNA-3-methyladenine glycosylase family protein n=1 Tax=Alicyclobacillus suci TaxID=2816080 RepID=UPI001A8C7B8C|nr:DNA-3-methyladenine glycosylase [Alicyclobacillus suci]